MVPLSVYVRRCRSLSKEEFLGQFPHAVLLHAESSGKLTPAENTQGFTLDRIVLSDGSEPKGKGRAYDSGSASLVRVFPLMPVTPNARQVTIGCSSECDVQINDRSISQLHAVVESKGTTYLIRDSDSTTGTQVNDKPLEPGQDKPLSSGDRISLGLVELTFLSAEDLYKVVQQLFGDRR